MNFFFLFFCSLDFRIKRKQKKNIYIYIETTIGLRLASANISYKNNVRIFENYFIYLFIYLFKFFFPLFPIKRRRSQERNLIGSRLLKDGISKLLLFTSLSFLHIIDKAHIDTQFNTLLEYINKFTQVYVWQKKKIKKCLSSINIIQVKLRNYINLLAELSLSSFSFLFW